MPPGLIVPSLYTHEVLFYIFQLFSTLSIAMKEKIFKRKPFRIKSLNTLVIVSEKCLIGKHLYS
jgi:hypothetical protein